MKHQISILAIVILLGIIVFAVMFRYEYLGARYERAYEYYFRADRWTGCVELWYNDSASEKIFKSEAQSCQ